MNIKYLLAAALTMAPVAANALTFDVYGSNAGEAQSVVQSEGYTSNVLSDLSTLSGVDVLWVLNGNNYAPSDGLEAYTASVASFVQGGGVLIYSDRNVDGAASVLPGASGISFTRDLNSDINVENPASKIANGPGGTVTDSTLDGGNYSDHGYATVASLPVGSVGYLDNGTLGNLTDFSYRYGQGAVYYSSIPSDYYLGGGSNFATIYAPNLVAEGASLVNGAVPEPATWAMMIGGVGVAGGAMRRRRNTANADLALA